MGNIKIDNYMDYRQLLNDYYSEMKQKRPTFSYQSFSNMANIKSRGFLYNVIQGKRNLTKAHVLGIIKVMKLKKNEADYFDNLVSFNDADNSEEKKFYFEKLSSIKSKGTKAWENQKIRNDQYEFYSKLHHSIIRSLIGMHTFKDDYEWLVKNIIPKVTIKQVKDSIKILEKLGFIEKNDQDNTYSITNRFISTDSEVKSLAILNYHKESALHAVQCITQYPPTKRNISGVMVGISENGYKRICDEIEKFRELIIEIAKEDSNTSSVYQLNLQLLPMSKI